MHCISSFLDDLRIPTALNLSIYAMKIYSQAFADVLCRHSTTNMHSRGYNNKKHNSEHRCNKPKKQQNNSAPINSNQRPKLIIPNTRLWDHEPGNPIRLHVRNAHIPPGRMHTPVCLIVRSEEQSINGFTVMIVSVRLYRLSVWFAPDQSPRAGVVVYPNGVPVQGAVTGAGKHVCFDCI